MFVGSWSNWSALQLILMHMLLHVVTSEVINDGDDKQFMKDDNAIPILYTAWGNPPPHIHQLVFNNMKHLDAPTVIIIERGETNNCNLWTNIFTYTNNVVVRCVEEYHGLDKIYLHNSFNSIQFEIKCLTRFKHLSNYCEEESVTRFQFIDSDIVMLGKSMFPTLSLDSIEAYDIVAHSITSSYYFEASCDVISSLIHFIIHSYSSKGKIARLIEKYAHRYMNRTPHIIVDPNFPKVFGHYQFSDMHMFSAFIHERTVIRCAVNQSNQLCSQKPKQTAMMQKKPMQHMTKSFLVGKSNSLYRYVTQVTDKCASKLLNISKLNSVVAIHFQGVKCKKMLFDFLENKGQYNVTS